MAFISFWLFLDFLDLKILKLFNMKFLLFQALLRTWFLFGVLSLVGAVQAQPSAGQLLQQNREMAPLPHLVPDAVPEPAMVMPLQPAEPRPGQATLQVKRFDFEGNQRIGTDELRPIVAAFLNKDITFDDLQRVADAVTEHYRKQGWLVRTALPQQDITDGVVTLLVIEARLGEVRIDNQSAHVSSAFLQQWVHSHLPSEGGFSLDALERVILNLNDLPDIVVTGSLQEGAAPGETVVLLSVADKPGRTGQFTLDNQADRYSPWRGTALLNINGAFGVGDQVSLYGMYSEANRYGRVGWTTAAGTDGWRVGASASTMTYRVLDPNFSGLNVHGDAQTAGLEAAYPLVRTRPANLMATVNWTHSQFRNWNSSGLNEDQTYNTQVAQFGLSGNLIDDLMGGGLNTLSLTGSLGNIGRNPAGQYNTNWGVAGSFAKLRYAASRTHAIDESLSAYVSFSGQTASKNMDSSEQFYVGGPMGVRAYASGQGSASEGHLFSFELRQSLPNQFVLTAFYDLGRVETWKFNNTAANSVDNAYTLQGVGVSLGWSGPYNLNLKATWAQRIGALTDSVFNNFAQNGGTSRNRIWLNASIPF